MKVLRTWGSWVVLLSGAVASEVTLLGNVAKDVASSSLPITRQIHQKIVEKSAKEEAKFAAYTETAANGAQFEMLPIPGGSFKMGSEPTEDGRGDDEGPVRELKIEPFWMGKCEVTWDLYLAFMESEYSRNKDGSINRDGDEQSSEAPEVRDGETLLDAVSQPTPPYYMMHFDMADGEGYSKDYPACSMTQHAASQFCAWLSAQTGHYYRLPTEAEWEYACRAGTTTAYHFGNDPAQLGDYAWFRENSQYDRAYEYEYSPVAQKKPNPWGLYDMYGNVAEWVLDAHQWDGYAEDAWKGYAPLKDGTVNPLQLSRRLYPRVARGGHFEMSAAQCRSAARLKSESMWKVDDPQMPQSMWYHTSARWLGFRVVRPVNVPDVEQMHLLWNVSPRVE